MRTYHGFTLIELLTGITILAIVLAIGIPSFTGIINSNRLASQSNDLVTSLTLARSEAAKRGINVTVCARSGSACTGATDWSQGWIAFTDDVGTTGVFDDPGDLMLDASPAGSSGLTITGDVAIVTFMPTGARTKAALTIAKAGCTGKNKRQIKVELTGRISLAKADC